MADMQISINIGGGGGVGGPQGPNLQELKGFQNEIKGKSTEELANKLADGNLKPWQQQEIMKEFMNKLLEQIKSDQTSPDEKKDLEKLLKDLKNSGAGGPNGAGGEEEGDILAKMLEALGIPPEAAKALSKAIAGDSKNPGADGQSTADDNKV